jgi:acyl-homoserine-lactone acylase
VGYAYARENFCVTMREYVLSAGESTLYFGDDGDFDADLVMRLYNSDARIKRMIEEDLPDYMVENLTGYAAGINRYLAETGVDNLAEGEEGCRGEPWVREIDLFDTVRLVHRTVLRASAVASVAGFSFPPLITAAQPGDMLAQVDIPEGMSPQEFIVASLRKEDFKALGMPSPEQMGSNAYAIGEQASQTDSGLLFGNPHFPWQGQERFFMFHVTLGDE